MPTDWVRINGKWVESVEKGGWVRENETWHWERGRGEFIKQYDTGRYVWVPRVKSNANSQEG